jgi:hypothetical protein
MNENTHSGGKSIRPKAKDPRCQMWFTVIQILYRSYHARGTKNDSYYRCSVLVSSVHLFRSTQGPCKKLAVELEEDYKTEEKKKKVYSGAMFDNSGKGDILASKPINNEAFCITTDLECSSLSLSRSGIKKSRICLSSCMTVA